MLFVGNGIVSSIGFFHIFCVQDLNLKEENNPRKMKSTRFQAESQNQYGYIFMDRITIFVYSTEPVGAEHHYPPSCRCGLAVTGCSGANYLFLWLKLLFIFLLYTMIFRICSFIFSFLKFTGRTKLWVKTFCFLGRMEVEKGHKGLLYRKNSIFPILNRVRFSGNILVAVQSLD